MSLLSNEPASEEVADESNQPANLRTQADEPGNILNLSNPDEVWKHALSLATEGNVTEASRYFGLHAALTANKTEASAIEISPTPVPKPTSNPTHGAMITEGGLSFIPGAITSHTDIGFTPYFDKNLKELKGPIPLTIFNKHWQDLANSYHVEKRVKTDNVNKDTTTYTGYPYPHEMTQSYSVWNVNYRNFVTTLRDVYQFKLFASWAETHQANV